MWRRLLRLSPGASLLLGPPLTFVGYALLLLDILNYGVPASGLGMLLFFLGGLGILHRQQNEIDRHTGRVADLEEQRPTITVTIPQNDPEGIFLDVRNDGEKADFEAQIEVVDGEMSIYAASSQRPPLPVHWGFWRLSNGRCAALAQGHRDRLMIARIEYGRTIKEAHFDMFYYDPRYEPVRTYQTSSWMLEGSHSPPTRLVLKITISASPKLPSGSFVETYLLQSGNGWPLKEYSEI